MAQLKDLLVEGKSRFIDKIYASDQFISKVVQGTPPFLIDSSTLVSNLNADLVDGFHAFGTDNIANNRYLLKQSKFDIGATTEEAYYRIATLSNGVSSSNRDALFYTIDIIFNRYWLYRVRHRGVSDSDREYTIAVVATNASASDLRIYYGAYNASAEIFVKQVASSVTVKTILTKVFVEGQRGSSLSNYIQLDTIPVTTSTYTNYHSGTMSIYIPWDNITGKPGAATSYGYIGTTAVQASSTANQDLTGIGTVYIKGNGNSWTEGIRIKPNGSWATILLGGNDLTADTGTSANSWSIHNYNGSFYIAKNGSGATGTNTAVFQNVSNNWNFAKGTLTSSNQFTAAARVIFSGLDTGSSDVTDGTEILTSYASNNGFADSNGLGIVYKRQASKLYNYIKSKTDALYLPLAGGWMNWNAQIYFKGLNNSTSVYSKIGYATSASGQTMHCVNTAGNQANGAFYITSNGSTSANDTGGLAIDNEGVTVFGAGDAGSNFTGIFRVLNEDNVADGPQFIVTKASGATTKYSHTAQRFISTVATGTQPYACTSTTLNTNLNADLLDGYHANNLPYYALGRNLNHVDVSTSWNGILPINAFAFRHGKPVFDDPDFRTSIAGVGYYGRGQSQGSVTRMTDASAAAADSTYVPSGNSSGYVVKIADTSVTANNIGGFVQTVTSGQNKVWVQIFRAFLPVGATLSPAANSMGTGSKQTWLTSNIGTGKWEWYALLSINGNGSSYSTFGHMSAFLTGGTTSNVWYLSYCNSYELTNGEYDGLRTKFADTATSAGNATNATTATTADTLKYQANLTTQEQIDNFLEASRFKVATFKTTDANNVGMISNDGMLLSIPWSSTQYGAQIALDDAPAGSMKFRGKNTNWGDWRTVIHDGNYTTYTVTKTGGGASGTWGINISGSAGSVAWANITGKPINFKAYSGSLASGGWKTLQGRDSAPSLAISYNNSAATWNSETYSTSMVWGCSDTRGLLDCGYNTPKVTFGGGSYYGTTDDNPKWYFKIKGTSGTEYDFDSRWSLSTHNHDSIYHPLNGKITRSGGSYSWYQFQQYKDASKNSPSYYSADCAIININSYSGWQPWIRGVASDLASWCIGQYTDALHVARIAVSNTTNTTTNRWDFQSNGNFKSAVGFVYGTSTYATSAYLLRADGGVTAASTFAPAHNHPYLPLAGGSMNNGAVITIQSNGVIAQNQANTSNYTNPIVWLKNGTGWYKSDNTTLYTYQPQIGQHNTGDSSGAITILPYATDTSPWGGTVGLYIGKTTLKWENNTIIHSSNIGSYAAAVNHTHSNYVLKTGDSMSGQLFIQTQTTAKTSPTSQQLVINGPTYDASATVDLKYYPGIGFHLPGRTWANLIWNGYFTGVNSDFSGYTGFYGSGFWKHGSSNSYVLLGAGGHKAVSDFATSSHTHSAYVLKAGDTMTGQLYINYDEDVGLNQSGSLVIGTKSGANIAIDANEIMARNNSSATTLYLNNEGGNIATGSGNFGIGTSSPSQKLHVSGNIYSTGKVFVNNTTTALGADNTSVVWLANSSGYPLVASANVVRRGASLTTGQLGDSTYPWAAVYSNMIYANVAGSNTAGGISLYSTTDPLSAYGIVFRGTGTSTGQGGKLGRVQGDWATYFTMNDSINRGWIFRRGTTNVASIAGQGEAYLSAVGFENYIAYPKGAQSVNNAGSVTGAIAIRLPSAATKSCTMLKITVEIYNYVGGTSSTYIIAGYNYNDWGWYNCTAYSLRQGSSDKGNLTIRYGDNGTRQIIWIGETNTAWSYPQVYVKDITLGHSGRDFNIWAQGWEIGFDTSLGNVRTTISTPAINNFATNSTYASILRDPDYYDYSHRRTSANINWADGGLHYYLATSTMTAANGKPSSDGHILHMSWDNGSYEGQLTLPTSTSSSMQWRSQNGGTWSNWITVLDSSNYGSYLGYIGTTAVKATSGAGQDMTGIGTIYIQGTNGSYREGIRIKPYSSWSTIMLGGTDLTADSGTSTKSWGLFNNDGNFYLTKNGSSSSSTAMLSNVSNNWNFAKGNVGIGVASPSSPLDVSGGYIKVTWNGNTLSIGSGNTSWTHFSNSSSRPFYFSHSASFNGAVLPYTDNSSTLGDSTHRWTTIYGMQATLKAAQGTAPLVVDSSTAVSNLNADFLDGLHESAFARKIVAGTTVAMANSGGTITVESNKIILVTTTNTSAVTFNFTWNSPAACDEAHVIITGSGSSKTITIGNVNSDSTNTKKNNTAIKVTSGGYGEISILYFDSKYFIRAVGN